MSNIYCESQPKLFSNRMLLACAVSYSLFKHNIQKASMIQNWQLGPCFNDNVDCYRHFCYYARSPVGEERPVLSSLRPSDSHCVFSEPDTGASAM